MTRVMNPESRRAIIYTIKVCLMASSALLLLGGCTVGPNYQEPELEMPDAWENAAAADVDTIGPVIEQWWTALGDTILDSLIAEARQSNLDLAMAVSRIREARAYHQIAGGSYYPQVQANGDFAWSEPATGSDHLTNWEFGLGASWELDVFGKVRRTREATGAQVSASIEDYRDVMVSLFAEVAGAYVDVRTLHNRLDFARNNVKSQRETMDIVLAREDAGLVPYQDVTRARSNLANTEAAIPLLRTSLEVARNRLAILLARPPGSLNELLAAPYQAPEVSTDIVLDLPTELLRRRPDIRRSERNLAAQTARIGAATADLYPSFSLGGVLSLQASEFSDLGDGLGWSLVPGVRWNLFTGGKIRGQIKVEEALTEQALAQYEKSVLNALAEVENTLVALRQEEIRRDLLEVAAEASQQSVDLVNTQYLEGLTDFQSYLDAQRVLFTQQDELAASRGQVVNYLVDMNRAMGGGWSLDDPDPDLPQQDETVAANSGGTNETEDKEEVNR